MTQLLHAPARADRSSALAAAPSPAPRDTHSTRWLFLTVWSLYLVAGWRLAIQHHAIVGDAMARVANGSYVLFSRDPHLAAVGFVWNPLPSFAALPLLPFARWFPELRTQAFAANIVSAAFMAGAVVVVWRILRELRLAPTVSIALTTLFAVHPLVLQYGANGDSEATLVFFLALTCLGLLRWLDRRDLASIMLIGASLGLGYLSRQEFLAAGAASLLLILGCTYLDATGSRRHRRWSALTETTLAAMPFVLAIVAWAGSAFVIVGTATSYLEVNSEQVGAARAGIATTVGGTGVADRLAYYLGQLLILEPLWSVLVLAAVVVAWRRRDARVFAPLVTFGAVAGAQGTLFGAGSTFGWLRFAITVVPLTVISAGYLLAPSVGTTRTPRARRFGIRTIVPTIAVVAGCALALPSAARGMGTARWGREEAGSVHLLPGYAWAPTAPSAYTPHWLDGYDTVARYLERLHLRDGTILTDTQYTFPLLLKTSRPHLFVVPSDSDFERSVADPATYRIRYLLMTDGTSDVLARNHPILDPTHHPHLSIGQLVRTFEAGPQTVRLFRVTSSVTGERAPAPGR